MKVVIIEDEIAAYNNIERLVKNCNDKMLNIVKWITSIDEALNWFASNEEPDLLLVDIHLGDGLVFEVLERIELRCPVVFTTAYDNYTLRAFNYNTSNYLLKPISQDQFNKMVTKVKKNASFFNLNASFHNLMSSIEAITTNTKNEYKERFLVKKHGSYAVVLASDIAFIHIDPAVILETMHGERYILNNTLNELSNLLNPAKFFRCNRQVIVNIDAIKAANPYFKNSLQLDLKNNPEFKVVIGKDKVKLFKQWMSN